MFTQMMVDIHANVSTNQLEDYLQYVKQKKSDQKPGGREGLGTRLGLI